LVHGAMGGGAKRSAAWLSWLHRGSLMARVLKVNGAWGVDGRLASFSVVGFF